MTEPDQWARMDTDEDTTLVEAKDWLWDHILDGAICPCCDQNAKVYRRKMGYPYVAALRDAYALNGTEWGNPSVKPDRSGNVAKLRYWGLMEQEPGKRNGVWRVTPRGEAFLRGRIAVAKWHESYNRKLLKLDDSEMVNVHQAWGSPFDIDEEIRRAGTVLPPMTEGDDD